MSELVFPYMMKHLLLLLLLTCVLSRPVLQEVQQDEARAETEAAPRPLPVRNVLQDDVAAPVSVKYNKSNFFVPHRQTAFLIS